MRTAEPYCLIDTLERHAVRVPIPVTRDPFINAPLIPVVRDAEGREWFWITAYNGIEGCQGALVSDMGHYRIYHFDTQCSNEGFQSVVAENADILWLCGSLDRVVRLTLSTGTYTEYHTGAFAALVFQGMIFDPVTGKLFAAAFPPPVTTAFSFDTRTLTGTKVFTNFTAEHYMRFSFPNGDGTYSFAMQVPGKELLEWDPRTDGVKTTGIEACDYALASNEAGQYYLPGQGWYAPGARALVEGTHPEQEMTWFGRYGRRVYGMKDGIVYAWELDTGAVNRLCAIPDISAHGVAMTLTGKIIAVNTYGVFYRFDGVDGTLELTRELPTNAVGGVDCIRRIDQHRLLGTTFITQRFWEVNLETGVGYDCGRAAPGVGEVLQTWKVGEKIYMAAYSGGELMEYDPVVHLHFPDNPRVVADPPGGMRPVAATDDGRYIYYACNAEYGKLGSTLTRYDTRTGETQYAINPMPDQAIVSLQYDSTRHILLCGTTYYADCQSCPPTTNTCYFATINADTLAVEIMFPAPMGTQSAEVAGMLDEGKWLAVCHPLDQYLVLDASDWRGPGAEALYDLPAGVERMRYAGEPGKFLLYQQGRLELWDLCTFELRDTLVRKFDGYNFFIQNGSLYLIRPREIIIIDEYLRKLRPQNIHK